MQLLTATKLSTVAMLVMASFLLTGAVPVDQLDVAAGQSGQPDIDMAPVLAVPMDQSANMPVEQPVVEEAPDAKASAVSVYGIGANGELSPQAIQDLFDIYALKVPEFFKTKTLKRPDDPNEPLNTLPPEMLLEIIKHMDKGALRNFALTDSNHFAIVNDWLSRQAKELKSNLDLLWQKTEDQLETEELGDQDKALALAVTPVWEETLQDTLGLKELKECPYHLLPYATDDEPIGPPDVSEKELAELYSDDFETFKAYLNRNICRLAVNGGYFWLMRAVTAYANVIQEHIFSVLYQLKLFSTDKALASDLDRIVELIISIYKADKVPIRPPNDGIYFLMLSNPSVMPILKLNLRKVRNAALLLLAFKQNHSEDRQASNIDQNDPLDIVRLGDVNEFIENIKPFLQEQFVFKDYYFDLFKSLFAFENTYDDTRKVCIDRLLNDGASGFLMEEHSDKVHKYYVFDQIEVYPTMVDIMANALDLNQFTKLYDELYMEERNPALIIMAGRSRNGPEYMIHVFQSVFGDRKVPISADLQIDGEAVNAEHLATLAQGCAIACVDDNWDVFVELFVDKVRATQQLSYSGGQASPPTATIPDQVAGELAFFFGYIRAYFQSEHEKQRYDEINRKMVSDEVEAITTRLDKLVASLTVLSHDEEPPRKRFKSTA